MIYVCGLLFVLAVLFDLSVWVWCRNNPIPPLSPIPDYRPWITFSTEKSYAPAYAASAVSIAPLYLGAVAYTASMPRLTDVPAGYRAP